MKNNGTQKHTPGPWKFKVFRATEDTFNHCIIANARYDGRFVEVARVFTISDDGIAGSESSINARLIAAAPDLLNMLQRMADETAGGFPPCLLTLEQARAAIAKAKGEAEP